MDNRNKWIAYIAIILVGGVIGYILGSAQHKSELFASMGVGVGFFFCLGLWLVTRNEYYRNPLVEDNVDKE